MMPSRSARHTYWFKRIVDILLAIVATLICLPVFFVIAVLIKIDDPGPIFFQHTRVGLNESLFKVWKFRTMIHNPRKTGPGLTEDNDPRITRLGKWLRRLSLDELPQVFNVLRGEMSIVGPRPEIPEIVDTYSKRQKEALRIKPGITGLSQINGRDDLPIDIKLDYELEYVRRCSFLFDLKIILLTIPALISGEGNRY